MQYPKTVEALSAAITSHDQTAGEVLQKANKELFRQGNYRQDEFPAYLLWMLCELETFEDREKAGRWLGWVMGKMDGIPALNLTTLATNRNLIRADKEAHEAEQKKFLAQQASGFPRFKIEINGETYYLPAEETAGAYDSGFLDVKLGKWALEADGRVRPITQTELRIIKELAEEYSASK